MSPGSLSGLPDVDLAGAVDGGPGCQRPIRPWAPSKSLPVGWVGVREKRAPLSILGRQRWRFAGKVGYHVALPSTAVPFDGIVRVQIGKSATFHFGLFDYHLRLADYSIPGHPWNKE